MFSLLHLNDLNEYFTVQSQRNNRGVYFYRIIGYDDDTLKFLRKYQTFSQRKGNYINKNLPNPDVSDINYISSFDKEGFRISIDKIKSDCSNLLKFLSYNRAGIT